MLLTLACAFAACTQPFPTAPDDALLLAQGNGEVTVAYYCGNTFQFRNRSQDTLTLQWRVHGVQEHGAVFLPARGAAEYSETYLTTQERGPLQVSREGRVFATVPNRHTPQCEIPVTDTTRPPLPETMEWPRGSDVPTVQAVGDSGAVYYAGYVLVEVADSASGISIRSLIARIRGEIIGGYPRARYYVIQIPPAPSYDSLLTLVTSLRGNPIVLGAMGAPFYGESGDVFGVYPNDGSRSSRSSMRSRVIGNANWSRIAIRAPLAWGCEQGDPLRPIAIGVLDYYFDPTDPDLAPGSFLLEPPLIETAIPPPATAARLTDPQVASHGQGVAGVVGGIGGNQWGVAGLIWNRNLRLYGLANGLQTIANFPIHVRDHLVPDLNANGVKAIVASLSFGAADELGYPDLERHFLPYFARGGVLVMPTDNAGPNLTLDQLRGLRGRSNGLRRLAAEMYSRFPGQVWFVAGMDPSGNRAGTRFIGVEAVAAPAVNVLTLGRPADFGGILDSAVRAPDGVSFAAPAVLGAAALLWSREPGMTGPQILSLLQAGSSMDRIDPFTGQHGKPPIVAPGVGLLDIYSSLKAQARGTGVPLCGNRLWAEGATLYAERGSAASEPIATLPSNVGMIWPYHGGRKIRIIDSWSSAAYMTELTAAGTWTTPQFWDGDMTGLAGSGPALRGFTHDRDSVAFVSGNTLWLATKRIGSPRRQVATLPVTPSSGSWSEACYQSHLAGGTWVCDIPTTVGVSREYQWWGDAYPVGEDGIVVVRHDRETTTSANAPYLDCSTGSPVTETSTCRRATISSHTVYVRSEARRIDRGTGQVTHTLGLPGVFLASVTGAEDGGEFATATGVKVGNTMTATNCSTSFFRWNSAGGADLLAGHPYAQSCIILDWQGGFGAAEEQLASGLTPSPDGFALRTRLLRTVSQ